MPYHATTEQLSLLDKTLQLAGVHDYLMPDVKRNIQLIINGISESAYQIGKTEQADFTAGKNDCITAADCLGNPTNAYMRGYTEQYELEQKAQANTKEEI